MSPDDLLVIIEKLFEDIVDYITDTTRRSTFIQEHETYRLNELWFYADFRETAAELACIPLAEIIIPKTAFVGMVDFGVVSHKKELSGETYWLLPIALGLCGYNQLIY